MFWKTNSLFYILILFLLFNCAKMGVITGGEKDTIPPVLINSIPDQKAINVDTKDFSFLFDEVINTDEIKSKLIISPYSDIKYEVDAKKNSLVLSFDSSFENNRTYIFNFADGIKDITEGNEAKTLKYVFSTGPILDSLIVFGELVNPLTNKLQEDVLVALYDSSDSLGLFNSKPLYFDYTNDSGVYQIENIRAGDYSIYAFNDKNNTFKAESDKEGYGFLANKLNISEPKDSTSLTIIKQNLLPIKIISSRKRGLYYDVVFTRYVDKLFFQSKESIDYSLNDNNKTLRFYPKEKYTESENGTYDSLLVYFKAYDSLSNFVEDTFYLSFNKSNRQKAKFEASGFPSASSTIEDTLSFKINFSKPVSILNENKILLLVDTIYKKKVRLYNKKWDKSKSVFSFKAYIQKNELINWKEEEIQKIKEDSLSYPSDSIYSINLRYVNELNINKVSFVFDYGSFVSVEKDTLKRKSLQFEYKAQDYFGMISGKVDTKKENYYVELVSKDFDNIYKNRSLENHLFSFKNIPPGSYYIRTIIDTNKNGRWDKGNIIKNIEPEEIVYFKTLLEVRSNWEVDNVVFNF